MTDTASGWIDRIERFLTERGYLLGASTVPAARYATRRTRNMGPFFPCTDFVFVHRLSGEGTHTPLEQLHSQARIWAEAQFRLPRILRYHIPNTVSIGVSDSGFTAEDLAFAQSNKLESPLVGGHKHSTYLFDVDAREMYSQGLEVTPGRYGSRVVSRVNPTNRTYDLMNALLVELRALPSERGDGTT